MYKRQVHSMALKKDGTVWTWGRNDGGQLGNNNTSNKSVSYTHLDVYKRQNYVMALKKDGTVFTWGQNIYGQLGKDVYKRQI